MSNNCKIVIPTAGWATRVRPQTWSKPKPLVGVAGRTSLDHLLDTFRSVFADFHSWILSGKPMDVTKVPFPTFLTGLSELNIVDAVLESARANTWIDVKYLVEASPSYL